MPTDSTSPLTEQTWTARVAERTVVVTGEMIDAFAALSGDTSPLHMDDEFARGRGFSGRVAHGMLLGALVSGLVGTELPGAAGVLHDMRLSFRRPCYAGDEVRIRVQVEEFIESVAALRLAITITSGAGAILARGTAQSGITTGE